MKIQHILIGLVIFLASSCYSLAETSICLGTTAKGSLKNGVQLPTEGDNYISYSTIAHLAGRTYVHSAVRDIILQSYASLYKALPDKVFKYAETGFKKGGKFRPHKTHQNGLSVDFMTPVLNQEGVSVHLPTHPLNKFGYNIEFDQKGRFENYRIDYEALAAHLVALHRVAKQQGYDLWRVIFDPKLQRHLLATQYGGYLQHNIRFSKRLSWVRHDEHYHVDFAIPCQ